MKAALDAEALARAEREQDPSPANVEIHETSQALVRLTGEAYDRAYQRENQY
jgi:hypothetical protein